MKKKYIWFFILLCTIVIISYNKTSEDLDIDTPVNSTIEQEQPTIETENYSFDYSDIHFTHSPSENIKVTINYPQFKDEKLTNLNKKIEEFAKLRFKSTIIGLDETSTLSLDETYTIKLANKSIVSIASTGNIFVEGASYPSLTNNSYNINPITLKEYSTENIINVSDEFATLLKNSITDDENLISYMSVFSSEELKAEISQSNVYLTDTQLVVILSIPHALGDYKEITFNLEDISTYMKI